MAVTTKSALADELGITRARVSQYVKAGLPVRSDGKLNRDDALNWIAQNQLSQTYDDKGVVRARKLAKPPQKRVGSTLGLDRELQLAQRLVGLSGGIAAAAALKAGTSIEMAYALDQLVGAELDRIAAEALVGFGHDPVLREITPLERAGRTFEADYVALAREHGTQFDEDACERFADKILWPKGYQQSPGSPAALAADAHRNQGGRTDALV